MLTGDRAMGATWAPEQIGWCDFETRSKTETPKAGPVRYACAAEAIVMAYAIGDAPVRTVERGGRPLHWNDFPKDFRRHWLRVSTGKAIWAAWNAGFDKAIWNFAIDGTPKLEPHHVIDVMAQAVASGLAPDLAGAAKQCGAVHKLEDGKRLIKLFCLPDSTATPQSHPAEWQLFLNYAAGDVETMRDVFRRTRQLPLAEWREYWAMEAINDRGVGIDMDMVRSAAKLAAEDRKRSAAEIAQLTHDAVHSVDQVAAITNWLMANLPSEGRDILIKVQEEVDEDSGEIIKPAKFQLNRKRVGRLLAYLPTAIGDPNIRADYAARLRDAYRLLQIRLYGGSKTPAKFGKMLGQEVDGILYSQYVFNGAAQTGRVSSKGVQIHNLARDTLPYEYEAIEALLRTANYDQLAVLGDDTPVARKLSLLIRPAFVPSVNRSFVWSDWSQIEARILPWLAGDVPGALERLQIFRTVDAEPNVYDLYTRTAATLSHVNEADVTKAMRQRGKVAELALGFGGGVGALQNMAAGYGLFLDDAEAKQTVERWRAANQWCVHFWGKHDQHGSYGLWGAIHRAMEAPGSIQSAGRISYVFAPGYLGGSLICILPSGRFLTYRAIKYERVEDKDEDDQPLGTFSTKLRFARGYGRVAFWHGMACENVVQAVAADVLRGTLVKLEEDTLLPIRLHTHDEIMGEIEDGRAPLAAEYLRTIMREGFEWSGGLPLMSQETVSPYYTKTELAAWKTI